MKTPTAQDTRPWPENRSHSGAGVRGFTAFGFLIQATPGEHTAQLFPQRAPRAAPGPSGSSCSLQGPGGVRPHSERTGPSGPAWRAEPPPIRHMAAVESSPASETIFYDRTQQETRETSPHPAGATPSRRVGILHGFKDRLFLNFYRFAEPLRTSYRPQWAKIRNCSSLQKDRPQPGLEVCPAPHPQETGCRETRASLLGGRPEGERSGEQSLTSGCFGGRKQAHRS